MLKRELGRIYGRVQLDINFPSPRNKFYTRENLDVRDSYCIVSASLVNVSAHDTNVYAAMGTKRKYQNCGGGQPDFNLGPITFLP